MIQTKNYSFDIPAGGSLRFPLTGAFLRITGALGAFDLRTDNVSLELAQIADGFKEKPFTFLELKDRSGAANTVKLVVSDEEFLNAPATSTAITSTVQVQTASMVHSAPAVGVASAQLIAANVARRYLLIQNNSATQTVWLRFGATAAVTAAPCIRIGPGGAYEMDSIGATQAIQAIADIAGASVTVVEG